MTAAASVVLADQLAKRFVAGLRHTASTYVPNPGLVLGVLAGPPLLLILGSLTVLGVFLALVGRWAIQVGISPIIPGVIAGGALANALDRAQFGVVRDFLSTPWIVVDVADVAVIVGMFALGVALALRVRQLHSNAQTITLEVRGLRASVVPARAA